MPAPTEANQTVPTEEEKPEPSIPAKKPYTSPEIVAHGTIEELTTGERRDIDGNPISGPP